MSASSSISTSPPRLGPTAAASHPYQPSKGEASIESVAPFTGKNQHPELTNFMAHVPFLGDWYCALAGKIRHADPYFATRVVMRTMAIALVVLFAGFPPTSAATALCLKVPYFGAFIAGFATMEPLVQYAFVYLGVSSSVAAYVGGVHILATAAKLAATTSTFFSVGAALYFATLIGAGVFCLMKAHELPSAGLIEHWRQGKFWHNPRNIIATQYEKEKASEEVKELQAKHDTINKEAVKRAQELQAQLASSQGEARELQEQLKQLQKSQSESGEAPTDSRVQLIAQLHEKISRLEADNRSLNEQLVRQTQATQARVVLSDKSADSNLPLAPSASSDSSASSATVAAAAGGSSPKSLDLDLQDYDFRAGTPGSWFTRRLVV